MNQCKHTPEQRELSHKFIQCPMCLGERIKSLEDELATIHEILALREGDVMTLCSIVGAEVEENLELTIKRLVSRWKKLTDWLQINCKFPDDNIPVRKVQYKMWELGVKNNDPN